MAQRGQDEPRLLSSNVVVIGFLWEAQVVHYAGRVEAAGYRVVPVIGLDHGRQPRQGVGDQKPGGAAAQRRSPVPGVADEIAVCPLERQRRRCHRLPGHGMTPIPARICPGRSWNGAGVRQPGIHARASATPGLITSRPVKKEATSAGVWLNTGAAS